MYGAVNQRVTKLTCRDGAVKKCVTQLTCRDGAVNIVSLNSLVVMVL